MPKFLTISSVRESLERIKADRHHPNCCNDLCDFFAGKNIDEIFNSPRAIREANNIRLIKSRINCSDNKKGSSHGYRVYYYVDRVSEVVTIIAFYPKNGDNCKLNLSNSELKTAVDEWRGERDAAELVEHDTTKQFEQNSIKS